VEFQEQIWSDLTAQRPAWILYLELKSSLAWDGRARRTLLDQIQQLIASEYELQAVMLVDTPKGRLISREAAALPFARAAIERAPGRIFLYRRRAEAG
jgi:hypothetical protein